MEDKKLIEILYRRYNQAALQVAGRQPLAFNREALNASILNLPIDDLGFTNFDGTSSTKIELLAHRKDKSKAFDVFRLGRANGRVWELVVIDGVDVPHKHLKTDSELVIFNGGGFVSHNEIWSRYRTTQNIKIDAGTAHGFVTDPRQGATVFLSMQPNPIQDPVTRQEDFVPAGDEFPIPPHFLQWRDDQLAALAA